MRNAECVMQAATCKLQARMEWYFLPTLNWSGKEQIVTYDGKVPYHVLNHKYNFGGDTENKIIHGDNLLALKSLLPLYESKVKCIYIDPPYNTGNEGWIYNRQGRWRL